MWFFFHKNSKTPSLISFSTFACWKQWYWVYGRALRFFRTVGVCLNRLRFFSNSKHFQKKIHFYYLIFRITVTYQDVHKGLSHRRRPFSSRKTVHNCRAHSRPFSLSLKDFFYNSILQIFSFFLPVTGIQSFVGSSVWAACHRVDRKLTPKTGWYRVKLSFGPL